MPERFVTPLPALTVLRPEAACDITAREAAARILPGLDTKIWGYNGLFPGPVIEVRRGSSLTLRLSNALPVPIVNHLHGGRTPPESDGYPTDFVPPGVAREYWYPNTQRAATLWYHDHRMDFTGPQVWRGLAGFYILRDEAELRLPLPRGDKEIPLMLCDRSFDSDGSLLYPSLDPSLTHGGVAHEYMGGVLGDVILVNGAPWPRLDVANRRYRFRILNASNARRYELSFGQPIVQIGGDGGLLTLPLAHKTLPIAPAERFDIVVDFSAYPLGSDVTLKNLADNGPAGEIMRFHVARREHDDSAIPQFLTQLPPPDESQAVATRTFDFSYRRADGTWTVNRKPFDRDRMEANPRLGTSEIWELRSDFSHPLHLHLVQFRVLSHSGRPRPYDAGFKDTIDLAPGEVARILVNFSGYRGRYVFHCHNLEHEDMAMMANFEVI
jgi:FtsP/CotA-like multicopper oxidase with cupredoxin domain